MNTVILMLTSAIAIAGEVMRAGSLVEVTEDEARDLLHRGKGELRGADPEFAGAITPDGDALTAADLDAANTQAAAEAAPDAAEAIAAGGGVDTAATIADQASQDATQDATAGAGTSDQAPTTDATQGATQADQAPATAGRRRRR